MAHEAEAEDAAEVDVRNTKDNKITHNQRQNRLSKPARRYKHQHKPQKTHPQDQRKRR
jgi:hypothetical protein